MSAAYSPPGGDTVQRLYLASESLRHLARTMPEETGGVAWIMDMIGDEVGECARLLDDGAPPDAVE